MNQVLIAAPISVQFEQYFLNKSFKLTQEHTSYADMVGIVTSNKLQLRASDLEKFPNLRWIARLGSGMEIIDTKYCDQKGIHYFSSPVGIANAVGEHTTGMMLGLLNRIPIAFQNVKKGKWRREPNRGLELESLILGIIGFGHTGSKVASKLGMLCSQVLAYDKYKNGFGNEFVTESSLDNLIHQADIISFHVPLNEETKHYYNDNFLQRITKPHYLINVSRGAVCHTPSILKGLEQNKLLGACLDVLEEEASIHQVLSMPNNIVTQLLRHNVIITPHIAGYSHQAIEKMSLELMKQLDTIL